MLPVAVIVPARRWTDDTVSVPLLIEPVPSVADRMSTSFLRTAHTPAASSSAMTAVANELFVMRPMLPPFVRKKRKLR